MKNIIASFALFIIVMLTVIFSINYLGNVCNKLEVLDVQIENNIKNDEWNKAYSNSIKFLDEWHDYSKKVSIFTHHAEIDNINIELWKLTQYTKCQTKDESLASAHVIKLLLNHLVELEKVNSQNIF